MKRYRKRKNPPRSTWQGRLTGWNREKFEKNNAELEKDFRDSINRLGFDSAFGMPDYVLSEALVSLTWSIARFYRQIQEHVDAGDQLEDLEHQVDAGDQLEDLEHQVDAGAGDPHELEHHVDAGAVPLAESGRDGNPSTPSPDILTVPDMMGLEHQVDAGAAPIAEGDECIHLQYGVPHRIADKLELLMAFLNGKACGTFNLHTIGRGAAQMLPDGFVPFWTVILREDELVQLKDAVQNMLFHYHAQKMLEEHQEGAGAEGEDQ